MVVEFRQAHSAQPKIIVNREAGVLQNAHRQPAADVAARVHWDGDGYVLLGMPQGKVTAGLTVFQWPT